MANVIISVDDLEKREEEEFRTGPLSVLTTSVKTNSQVGGGHNHHAHTHAAHTKHPPDPTCRKHSALCCRIAGAHQLQEQP